MYNINYLELFILNTLIYFDLFDYPLTLPEIHRFLYSEGMQGGNFSLLEIEECLKTSEFLKKNITAGRGFYFFYGRENLVDLGLERYNLAAPKYKLARRALKLFRCLPFIKLAAVCNSLSYFNAKESSDIDLFVITASNRLWTARLALMVASALLGLRPPKRKVKDKICLSFMATEDNLDLSKIKIAKEDTYLDFWLATLQPLYVREDFYTKFLEANSWLKKYFPNFLSVIPGQRLRVEDGKFNKGIYESKEYILQGRFGDWVEAKLKKLQLRLMSQRKKDLAVIGDKRVIISDTMLKFHDPDRRLEYLEKFEAKRKQFMSKI